MRIMISLLLTGCLLLASCGYTTHRQRMEYDCFSRITISAGVLASNSNSNKLHIWPIDGRTNGDKFLLDNGYVAYLSDVGVTHSTSSISADALLTLTGNVVLEKPSWGEHYIGKSHNNVQYEAIYNEQKYLIFQDMAEGKIDVRDKQRCAAH